MSYWIEYQAAAFVVNAADLGLSEPRFALAIEGGSNNLTQTARNGREYRVREWYLSALGTYTQVLRHAVRIAADCEGRGLQLEGRKLSPEAYIRRCKRMLEQPRPDFERHIVLAADLPADHPVARSSAQAEGFTRYEFSERDVERVKLIPLQQNPAAWATLLNMLDPYLDDGSIPIGRLGQVYGMPSSFPH